MRTALVREQVPHQRRIIGTNRKEEQAAPVREHIQPGLRSVSANMKLVLHVQGEEADQKNLLLYMTREGFFEDTITRSELRSLAATIHQNLEILEAVPSGCEVSLEIPPTP